MTGRILRQIVYKSSKVAMQNNVLVNLSMCNISGTQNCFEKIKKKDDLGHTTILLQDGVDIQELPSIVRKVNDVGSVTLCNFNSLYDGSVPEKDSLEQPESSSLEVEEEYSRPTSKLGNETETKEMIEGFNRCFSPKGVYLLLETIPVEEVTPPVALQALKKIVDLEVNQQFRNTMVRSEDMPDNFARTAIFNHLMEIIACSPDSEILIQGLKLLNREFVTSKSMIHMKRLCDEILVHAADGKLSVMQVCEVVKIFATLMREDSSSEEIDKLWIGLVEKESEIDEYNIIEVFRILAILKQSRKMVFNILEKKLSQVWWKLPGNVVVEILAILHEVKLSAPRMLGVLSRWTNTNIHAVSEEDLLEIVRGFIAVDYVDMGVEKALERYVKAKGIKIKNIAMIAAIMDYCAHFRFRSHHILQGSAEYFIHHAKKMSPPVIKSMFVPLGVLDYHPSNGFKFWQTLEDVVECKFAQFRPEDLIDVMLTCVYLEKYPVNFVKKILNPFFLDRLHSHRDPNVLRQLRAKLKIFDTAMTLECSQYRGPMLPRDHSAKSIWLDGRIRRMINLIYDPLSAIVGGSERVTTSVIMPQLPTSELYIVDVVIHPSNMGGSMLPFNIRRDHNLYVAVLIHIPEHYCSSGERLLGPQVMRKRHLKKLGFKVAELDYTSLSKLRVHPKELQEYLVQRLKMAEDSF